MNDRQRRLGLALLALLTLVFLSAAVYLWWDGQTSRQQPITIEPLQPGQAPQALRLTVYQTGLAVVSAQQVNEANLPLESFSADGLSLSRDGQAVPFYVRGEGREAILYFYGQAYTDTLDAPAVYWLTPGRGEAMAERNADPAGDRGESSGRRQQRWEENTTFLAQSGGDDVWLGKLLFAPNTLDIPLTGIRPNGGPGQLTIRIWSNNQAAADPDHHVEILLNGQLLANHKWDGIKQETITLPVAAGLLQPDDNILTVSAPGDTGAAGEALYIDWLELVYDSDLNLAGADQLWFTSEASIIQVEAADSDALVFDVTDPDEPVMLTGLRRDPGRLRFSGGGRAYVVLNHPDQALAPTFSVAPAWPEPLKAAGRGADYIAIVADAEGFTAALQPLINHRQKQGLAVAAVPLNQVFDEFGFGRRSPTAIRNFLAYAAANWQEPAPRYVLLVGDASYDIYHFTQGRNHDLLPTHLVFTEYAGYVASDTWYTLLEDSTLAPSLAIGRLPAQTADQLTIMVNKIIAYEQGGHEAWAQRALLVADDEPAFDRASNDLADALEPTGYQTQKLYMTENENIDDALISALNQGVGILNYVGHGSIEVWGDERVFESEDASVLINGNRLPIFTTFTCLNGYFNHPEVDALAETLLWAEDGGVVAAVAPSGRSLTLQQLPIADVFYRMLLSGEATTLGEALQEAKVAGAADASLSDVIHTFNLLGDPALQFQRPSPSG
jgi:hypothetical protein